MQILPRHWLQGGTVMGAGYDPAIRVRQPQDGIWRDYARRRSITYPLRTQRHPRDRDASKGTLTMTYRQKDDLLAAVIVLLFIGAYCWAWS